jgi:hypothetical protein
MIHQQCPPFVIHSSESHPEVRHGPKRRAAQLGRGRRPPAASTRDLLIDWVLESEHSQEVGPRPDEDAQLSVIETRTLGVDLGDLGSPTAPAFVASLQIDSVI